MEFINSIQSEWIKKKRSVVNWLVIIGGLFIPAIMLLARLIRHSQTVMTNSTDGVWLKTFDQCWQYMSFFLLPMGITLAASLITQIEYRNNAWKQVLSSPQRISTLFWAKYLVVLTILMQFFILFTLGIYLVVAVPGIVYADVPYPKEVFPFADIVGKSLHFFITCLPVLALQYLLSLHIRNFIVSIGVGFALVIASLIAVNWEYGYFLPYTYGALQFLQADNKISPLINIHYWAWGYFIFFTLINYIIFLLKFQNKFSVRLSKYINWLDKNKLIAGSLVTVFAVAVLFFTLRTKSTIPPIETTAEVENKIKQVEQNLGAFVIPGVNDWTLSERMQYYKVKGLSIAIVKNYQIAWARAYGMADSAENKPLTVNTLFIPGSLSKSVNAVGVLKLVEHKQINLFDDINNYLRSWKFPYDSITGDKKITLANLLSHTAGLSVHGFYGYKNGDTLPNIVQILDGKKPANSEPVRSILKPGTKMKYSGGGTMISQLITMDVSKQEYDKYMYEQVLQPLGMNNSFYTQPPAADKIPLLATGYDSLGHEIKGKYPILMEQAAGGLWTTPTDMCKFIIEIQRSLQGKSNKVLSKNMTELMLTPYLDERAALGFFIDNNQGYKYFGHEAGNRGFSGGFFGSIKDGNGVAAFINSENSDLLKEVVNSIIAVYQWPGFPKRDTIHPIQVPDSIMKKYAGEYRSTNEKEQVVRVFKENEEWCYEVNGSKRKMYFISHTDFVNNQIPSRKSFQLDENGTATGIKIDYLGKSVILKKQKVSTL